MRFALLTVLVSLATLLSAQDLSLFPSCVLPCLESSITTTGCQITDFVCLCTTGRDALVNNAEPCAVKACPADQLTQILDGSNKFCSQALASASATGTSGPKQTTGTSAVSSQGATASSSSPAQQTANAAVPLRLYHLAPAAVAAAVGIFAL